MAERRRARGADQAGYTYPRTARVNEVLRQVLAEELERLADTDERLSLATITGVTVDPDLRHAKVWLSSLPDDLAEGLIAHRIRLQAAIGRQVRLKRTPLLAFEADPAVSSGSRVEEVLRRLGAAVHRPAEPAMGEGKGEESDG